MPGENKAVYLKADGNVEVKRTEVSIGDVFQVECAYPGWAEQIRKIRLFEFPADTGKNRQPVRCCLSVLKAVETIHKVFPDAGITCIGSTDIFVTFRTSGSPGKAATYAKTAGVALLTFAGASFSIMSFNNDVNVTRLFDQIYQFVTGTREPGFTILELTYSLGLVIGILIFFNHFGKKKFSQDPTPIEVQMRTYEQEVQNALTESYSRKGKELDVDTADHSGGYRT